MYDLGDRVEVLVHNCEHGIVDKIERLGTVGMIISKGQSSTGRNAYAVSFEDYEFWYYYEDMIRRNVK